MLSRLLVLLLLRVNNIFNSLLVRFSSKVPNLTTLKRISLNSFYPFDLVIKKDEYQNLITLKDKVHELMNSSFGIIIGIENFIETTDGLVPEKVKVVYFNFCDYKVPIIKIQDTKDLVFLLSPTEELIRSLSMLSGINEIFNTLLEETNDLDIKPDPDTDPDSGNDGGPIIH